MAVTHPGPIFSTISNTEDIETLPSISPKFVPGPLYASSWINPEWFPAEPTTRDIDVLIGSISSTRCSPRPKAAVRSGQSTICSGAMRSTMARRGPRTSPHRTGDRIRNRPIPRTASAFSRLMMM
jgi:hypothetical protein